MLTLQIIETHDWSEPSPGVWLLDPPLAPGVVAAVRVVYQGTSGKHDDIHSWKLLFTVGSQHFVLAEGEGAAGKAHCKFIGEMFVKALDTYVTSEKP